MSAASKIEWTDVSWNPVRGCSRVSEGCRFCYAERLAGRFSGPGKPYEGLTVEGPRWRRWNGEIRLLPELLNEPLRWRKPKRVFVNSMSDLFHEKVPEDFVFAVFQTMGAAFRHTYQVLTKRPDRMREVLPRISERLHAEGRVPLGPSWRHVHLGVSVEDQETADGRIPLLLQTPAAVHWVSYEPALGPVDFTRIGGGVLGYKAITIDALHGGGTKCEPPSPWGVDWVVVGGESGPGARPCDLAWIRSIVEQCKAANVPVFVKQLGACASDPVNGIAGAALKVPAEAEALISRRLRDRKGADMNEWPADLRVREYPR